jgi:hypothetical protein
MHIGTTHASLRISTTAHFTLLALDVKSSSAFSSIPSPPGCCFELLVFTCVLHLSKQLLTSCVHAHLSKPSSAVPSNAVAAATSAAFASAACLAASSAANFCSKLSSASPPALAA